MGCEAAKYWPVFGPENDDEDDVFCLHSNGTRLPGQIHHVQERWIGSLLALCRAVLAAQLYDRIQTLEATADTQVSLISASSKTSSVPSVVLMW